MTMKLVYKGSVPASFASIGAELNPGDEFNVPDDQVESFLQRSDIEIAADHSMAEPDDIEPVVPVVETSKTKKAPTADTKAS